MPREILMEKILGFIKSGLLVLLVGMVIQPAQLKAQTIPVGDLQEEKIRLMQLFSDSTAELPFTNRPISRKSYQKAFEHVESENSWWADSSVSPEIPLTDDFTLGFYEPEIQGTYNHKLPYGENNGAAWYGRGMNTEFKGGFYINSHFLDITIHPQIVHQQNEDFEVPRFIPRDRDGNIRYVAQGTLPEDTLAERIDRPFRFGPDSYTTINWGHSSVRFHRYNMEIGLSSEPLWWGPGVQYALTLSNNAGGVPHAFLGNREPIELPYNIGQFQFRWVWGWPKDSKYFDLKEAYATRPHQSPEKFLRRRFMNGLNIVYSPSFLPNFHIGTSRIIHQYIPESGMTAGDYLAIFRSFPNPDEKALSAARDASHYEEINPLSSVYFRWVFPESNAEVYAEYMKDSHSWNFRDFLMEPQHGRAYTIGAQKIIKSGYSWLDFVKVNAEINSLMSTRLDDIRPQTYLYSHKSVKQGHTHRGQVLGAAIGPGSTSQYIGAESYFEKGRIGFFVQRTVDNNHLHYEYYQRWYQTGWYGDMYRHRVDVNIGLDANYRIYDIMLGAGVVWNKKYNYGRFGYGDFNINWNSRPRDDRLNMQYQFSVRYLF
ncbi:capsule assembly Wzi family protein [Aliifodinibius salicampi]|uniref:Capsule assembly Wzi family protein n=1 Tax=Fodinibius salicampi TaxID=1920655 RepID=A0ABT3PZ52_9BACT|nr:capsule assembly Wzi family protein [Fodinibius salicampi]MCW9713129.1 capsule assembly Wzi family protein [Fodinibius salicampi]